MPKKKTCLDSSTHAWSSLSLAEPPIASMYSSIPSTSRCVICRLDYEEDGTLTVLSCKHSYHSECINNWLQINKVCPVCSAEVVTAGGNN